MGDNCKLDNYKLDNCKLDNYKLDNYKLDNCKIIEEKNKIFKILFNYQNQVLINSLLKTKIIQGGTSSSDYKTLKFKADSVKSLHQFQEEKQRERGKKQLNINEVASLMKNLTSQLTYIIKTESRTILGYNPENIIVINDHIFAYLGSELISNKLENDMALISYPFTREDFFVSPELLKIRELPSYIHYKTAYFSLGCLALYTLLSDNETYTNYLQEQEQEQEQNQEQNPINLEILLKNHPIKHTKLYWLLSRCLTEDPKIRSIIFI
jgi:hypothetical protein